MKTVTKKNKNGTAWSGIADLLKNNYNIVEFNKVWFVDFSSLNNFWIFVVLEASTRKVIGFSIKESKGVKQKCGFTTEDCIRVYANVLLEHGSPGMIHSDNGGQFLTKKYIKYLESENIGHSVVDLREQVFGNQVMERFFNTLKRLLRDENPMYEDISSRQEMDSLLDIVIQLYNNKHHKSLLGLNPEGMTDALSLYTPGKDLVKAIGLVEGISSSEDHDAEIVKSLVVKNYAGNWLNFFLAWRKSFLIEMREGLREENKLQTLELIENYEGSIQQLKEHHSREVEMLRNNLVDMQRSLSVLEMEALAVKAHKEMLADKKRRNKERTRLPVRDAAGLRELKLAIAIVQNNKHISAFVQSRDIVCLSLLFLTGLRVSNLLKLQVSHVVQLLEDDKFDLGLIKSRQSKVHSFYLPSSALDYFNEIRCYFNVLIQEKEPTYYLITDEKSGLLLSEKRLINRLNLVLKEVSKLCHKNIKTHSFRINLTTALIETVGIDVASKTIGHADIRTTELYSRRSLGFKELSTIYNKAHKHIGTIDKQKEVKRRARTLRAIHLARKKKHGKDYKKKG